jgi:hypothetical protein
MNNGIKIACNKEVFGNVLLDKLESIVAKMMLNVVGSASQQVVKDNNIVAASDQPINNVRPEKSRAACNEHTHLIFTSILA